MCVRINNGFRRKLGLTVNGYRSRRLLLSTFGQALGWPRCARKDENKNRGRPVARASAPSRTIDIDRLEFKLPGTLSRRQVDHNIDSGNGMPKCIQILKGTCVFEASRKSFGVRRWTHRPVLRSQTRPDVESDGDQ